MVTRLVSSLEKAYEQIVYFAELYPDGQPFSAGLIMSATIDDSEPPLARLIVHEQDLVFETDGVSLSEGSGSSDLQLVTFPPRIATVARKILECLGN